MVGTSAHGRVESRVSPIGDDTARAQLPVAAGLVIFIGCQRRANGADGKGRRESNLGQHFCFSIAALIRNQQYGDFGQQDKGSML
jgi:hypothetical protein